MQNCSRRWPHLAVSVAIAALASLGLFAGCGAPAPATANYNAENARHALVAALDAWRDGQLPALTRRSPPLHFTDDDLIQGFALISYELDPAVPIEPHKDVPVTLVLRNRQGATVNRQAMYQISLEPSLAVLRNDP